jgi:hypothetical protein
LVPSVLKTIEKIRKSKGLFDIKFDMNYTYNGDNIKECTLELSINGVTLGTGTITYISYDNKQNPFYHKFEMTVLAEFSMGSVGVQSKNNPTEIKMELKDTVDDEFETSSVIFSYVYDKDFPVEVTTTYKFYEDDEPMITKLYYEYK